MKTHSESENHLAVQFCRVQLPNDIEIGGEAPRNREPELVRDILSRYFDYIARGPSFVRVGATVTVLPSHFCDVSQRNEHCMICRYAER